MSFVDDKLQVLLPILIPTTAQSNAAVYGGTI